MKLTRIEDGYVLEVRSFKAVLTEYDAASLLHQLLVLLPRVPIPSKQVITGAHKLVAVPVYEAHEGEVIVTEFRVELHVGGDKIVTGFSKVVPEGVELGKDLVSYNRADHDATIQQLVMLAESEGTTLKALLKELQR